MLTTSLLMLFFAVSTVLQLLVSAWLLRLGSRWSKIPDVSFKRTIVAVLLIGAGTLLVRGAVLVGQNVLGGTAYLAPVVELFLVPQAAWKVVQRTLRTSFGKAIVAWLPTLLGSVVAWVLVLALVRPFLVEAFVVPTNAMAPTILGRHFQTFCPACGAPGYVSASGFDLYSPAEELGICGGCLHVSQMPMRNKTVLQGDKLIVNKLLQPQRWDVIVFRYPEDPSVSYVMRLVGLPGEEVTLKGGDVWIDGTRIQKPDQISGLMYSANPFTEEVESWGPAELGSSEYFVLGDFSLRSRDSRLWETGAPGHPSYAVPKTHFVGVVTHICWPPSRWRILR